MALSLFGGKKHLHHFVAEQDVAKELFALLVEAKTMYLRDVVTGNKQYYRYVEDFVNSHRYIDCDHAVCRNCHEMNIHIVKGLLNDCSHLIRAFFTEADFSFEKCMELKRTMIRLCHHHSPSRAAKMDRQEFILFLLDAISLVNR